MTRFLTPLSTLSLFSIGLGALFVYLFFDHGLGLNAPLFIGTAILFGVTLTQQRKRVLSFDEKALLLIALLASVLIFIRSSLLLTALNLLTIVVTLLLTLSIARIGPLALFQMRDYVEAIFTPLHFIAPFFKTLRELAESLTPRGSSQTREVVRGTLMAIVAVGLFSVLLASADAVVHDLFSRIFSFQLDDDTVARGVIGTVVASFFLGCFSYYLGSTPRTGKEIRATRLLGYIETRILLGSVAVLFGAFIVLQASYLFGGFEHLTLSDRTYAEYAREGFAQLVAVALLAFGLILSVAHLVIKDGERHSFAFKLLSAVLVSEVLLILVSAFSRLSLYEAAYGYTLTRLLAHSWMIWLAGALVLLAYAIMRDIHESQLLRTLLYSLVVFVCALNLINPDRYVALQNIARYHETGKIDATYLGYLSIDALPTTISLIEDSSLDVRTSYARALAYESSCTEHACTTHEKSSWQGVRLGTSHANSLLLVHRPILESMSQEDQSEWIDD